MLRWTGAWDDYLYWQTRDKRTLKHVNVLIRDAMRSPFAGLDKPEPLNGNCRERGASHRFREPAGVYDRGRGFVRSVRRGRY